MSDSDASPSVDRAVTAHYARHDDLIERVRNALPAAGGAPDRPTYDALHHLDQFHLGGPMATRELAETAGLRGDRLLDLGCGIGGPSRMLAAEYDCDVTGLDLTERYCALARELSTWVSLHSRTRFVCASARALPFEDAAWPLVWSQHAAMNIPDKARMYREVARVLAPGGRFVMHDIVAGTHREPHFPVPWASEPGQSFLLPAGGIHALLTDAGLEEILWHDKTSHALTRVREARAAADAGEPEPPGPQLLMGPEFTRMRRNLARNLEEGRVAVIQAIWRKP